ncbi:MAG TPA: methionine--tRNA ligase [Clostridia bacterium]|nr:methionine--tRNA ligase [Clostridia bacterium]
MSKPIISYPDFAKLDLRVGTILESEPVEASKKLVKFLIDLGPIGQRTILAGVKDYFEPRELVGTQVLVLANLEPKKMMGLESQGMILMGDVDGRPVLLIPQNKVPVGTGVE